MIGRLKLAIDRRDWNLVEECYNDLLSFLSDGAVKPPEAQAPKREQPAPHVTTKRVNKDFTVEGRSRVGKMTEKVVAKPRENKFNPDSFEEDKLEGADLIDDSVAPTPRNRRPPKTKCVHCNECNKDFEVSPLLTRFDDKGNYICDYKGTKYKCPNLSQN